MDEATTLDPATITTRKDAEAFVRSIHLTCRGPKSEKHAAAIAQLLDEGRNAEAADMDDASRRHPLTGAYNCGANTNDVICAGPFDGAIHEYTCPRCGVHARYRAPLFPGLSEADAADPAVATT
ncbi:MAG TPA: hypothetical protein VGQ44_17370 [Gemmatimonadaceae bacterium]|jgi:hypothetical protein|nr:hypothetical protein [Gemmatimonadaceae bacterium]